MLDPFFALLGVLALLKEEGGGLIPAPPGVQTPPKGGGGTTPAKPATPATPATPAKPATSAKPATPATPATPAKPSTPATPATPAPAATLPPWPTGPTPGTLPTFPGPGWCPDTPVTPAVSARASYWNNLLWDTSKKTVRKPYVQEMMGGQWVTFAAAWHAGDSGPQTFMATEAWRVCTNPPVAPSPTPAPAPGQHPSPVSPYPGAGAYASNGAYITRYQNALQWLSQTQGQAAWDPKGVDGKYGPNTSAAVKAFQTAHGLTADGAAGADTAAALDVAMGYSAPAPAPAPAAAPAAAATTAQAPGAMPAAVLPYPGSGAWQSNADYIGRYQYALQWLSRIANQPSMDPGAVDHTYGPKTAAAVKAFQAFVNPPLNADGEVGQETAQAIDEAVASYAPHN